MLSLYMHKRYIISHICALNFPNGCLYFAPMLARVALKATLATSDSVPPITQTVLYQLTCWEAVRFHILCQGQKKRQQLQHKFGGRQEGRRIQLFWKVDEGVNILASYNNYDCLTHLNTPLEADRCILMTDGCVRVCVYTECKLVCVCVKREWEQKRMRESSMSHL